MSDMREPLEIRNARAVLATWRRGDHLHAWGPAAHDSPPSVIARATVDAWVAVQQAADLQADTLIASGFLPGHAAIRELRGVASTAADRATRTLAWTNALATVEAEGPTWVTG